MAEFHNRLRDILFFTGLLIKSGIKVLFSLTRAIDVGAPTCGETRGIDCNSSVIVFCFGTATLKFQVFVLTHYLGLKHCGLAFVSHFNVFAHSRTWITTCNSVNKILEFPAAINTHYITNLWHLTTNNETMKTDLICKIWCAVWFTPTKIKMCKNNTDYSFSSKQQVDKSLFIVIWIVYQMTWSRYVQVF